MKFAMRRGVRNHLGNVRLVRGSISTNLTSTTRPADRTNERAPRNLVARKLNAKHRANEFALSRLGHRLSRKTQKKVRRPVDSAGNDVYSEWGTVWRVIMKTSRVTVFCWRARNEKGQPRTRRNPGRKRLYSGQGDSGALLTSTPVIL